MYRKDIDIREVIQLYAAGWSMQSLAKKYRVDNSTIKRRLVDSGVQLRDISSSVKHMLDIDPSMRDRTGRSRQHSLDVHCLDELSPDGAYILGLYQADGYVNHKRVSITLKPSDRQLLERVALFFGTDRPLIVSKSPLGEGVSLDISSVKLASAFRKWGISSPKTDTASTHHRLRLDRDYWRGVVDGDGSLVVTKDQRKIIRLVGSEPICHQFLAFCRTHNCGSKVNVCPQKTIFTVALSGNEAYKIAQILYRDSNLYLARKREVFNV